MGDGRPSETRLCGDSPGLRRTCRKSDEGTKAARRGFTERKLEQRLFMAVWLPAVELQLP